MKRHKTKLGHDLFEGSFQALRDWRKGNQKSEDKRRQAEIEVSSRELFAQVVPPPPPISFLPEVQEGDATSSTHNYIDGSGVRANIPEAHRPVMEFIPFNPFLFLPKEPEPEAEKKEDKVEEKPVAKVVKVEEEVKVKKPVKVEAPTPVVAKPQKAEGRVLDFWIEATASDLSVHGNKNFSDQAEATKDDLVEKLTEAGMIGMPTAEWLMEELEKEWTASEALQKEWDYVNAPVPMKESERELVPGDGRDEGHEGMTLADFGQLSESQVANLDDCELLALRLYTGPGFSALNASCRAGTNLFSATAYCIECAILKIASSAEKVCDEIKITLPPSATQAEITRMVEPFGRVDKIHMPVDKITRLGRGVFFVRYRDKNDATAAITGLHGKDYHGVPLEVVWAPAGSAKNDTFRGLSGKMPPKFVAAYNEGRKMEEGDAIADASFLSTTKSREIALGSNYGGNIIFVIRGKEPMPGLLRGGADIEWISQFPREEEVLFPRFTELWYNSPLKRCITREFSALPGCNKFVPASTGAQWGKTPCQNCEFSKSQHPLGGKSGIDKQIFEFSVQYAFNKRFTIPNLPNMRCKALRGLKLGHGELQNNKRPQRT